MFDTNAEVQIALERLQKEFAGVERGVVITWDQIEVLIGRSRYNNRGKHIIRQFRKWLQNELCIVTLSSRLLGLRCLTHEQAVREIPEYRQRKARRQVNRCLRELNTVDTDCISIRERQALAAQRANLRYERLTLGRSYRQHERELRPTEVNPKRKSAREMETSTV